MAGGTWLTQNKVRPGVYIHFATEPSALGNIGERGIASMALPLSWGPSGTVLTINSGDDLSPLLGYGITEAPMLLIKEALKRAKTLLLYRLNVGTKAAATHGSLTINAKYGGVRGNDITIVVQENVDDSEKFDVITYFAGAAVETQTVANIGELADNAWVDFSGTGALTATVGVPLVGGEDGTVTNGDHSSYLAAVELLDFNTIALVSTDAALKSLYAAFVRRLREEEGKRIQVVVENYPAADYEGVISVKNGVELADGTVLSASEATAWVAGATAAAAISESLTYAAYDDAVDAATRYTNSQIETALQNGELVFVPSGGRAVVEQDINTLTGFTPEHGRIFAKNRVVRVFDGIANDIRSIFERFYIGKVDNNADGRSLLQGEIISYMTGLQDASAIQNFDAQKDVTVTSGQEADSVYIEVSIQPVDAVEKIYMKVRVM